MECYILFSDKCFALPCPVSLQQKLQYVYKKKYFWNKSSDLSLCILRVLGVTPMLMFFQKVYKSNWEKQREKGFELRLDSLSILTAKAKRDLASDVSYSKNSLYL